MLAYLQTRIYPVVIIEMVTANALELKAKQEFTLFTHTHKHLQPKKMKDNNESRFKSHLSSLSHISIISLTNRIVVHFKLPDNHGLSFSLFTT